MAQEGDIEEEYLTCYICYDVFTEPKTLACLHRFCERCLQGYLVGLAEQSRKKGFPCPVCRELNPAPDPRRPAADWASMLRTDFHLKNLIKALKSGAHKPHGSRQGKKASGNLHPCSVHKDKDQDLYCVDCSSSICHLCAGISHRGCSQVITLSEAATDRRATLDLQHRHLAVTLGNLSQLRAQIDSAIDNLSSQHRKAEASIRDSSQKAIATIRRQETVQIEELQRTFQALRADVAKRLLHLDNRMTECQQLLDTVQSKMKGASDTEMIKYASSLLHHDKALDEVDEKKVHNILTRLKNIQLEFRPATITQCVKLGEISLTFTPHENQSPKISTTIPSGSPKTHPHLRPAVPPRQRSRTLATMETPHLTRAPVKIRTISGKFREDQHSPKLRDVLALPALKMVLVTDWTNQCVKAFHERRDRDSRLCLGGKPWCLTRVTDTTVAVSVPVSTQICVLKVTPRLALQSSFFAQKRYSGLAALSSNTLVASGGSDPPCVDIINLGGEVLRSFSRDVSTGRELFLYPGYIALMADRKHFLVSDRRRAALVCLNTSGKVQFIFQPKGSMGLQEPNGVRTDRTGAIYLAEPRGVIKVTPQGKLDRVVLRSSQDGVEDPRSLDVDEEEGLLYITSREEELVVFKMF